MPTENQRNILRTIGPQGLNEKVASGQLGKSDATIRMAQTDLFQEFIEDLELMNEYYPLFERRFSKNRAEYNRLLRRLARLVNHEAKPTS